MTQPRIRIVNPTDTDRIVSGDYSVIVDSDGDTTFNTDIIPANNNISIGSELNPWRDVYISSGSLVIADTDPMSDAVSISNTEKYIIIDRGGLKVTADDETHEIFQLDNTGKLTLKSRLPLETNSQALLVIGNLEGTILSENNPSMLLVSGIENITSSITVDGIGYNSNLNKNAFAAYIGRVARGSVDSPSQSLSGDVSARFGGNPYSSVSGFSPLATAYIQFVASENQTSTGRGSNAELWVTPIGSTTAIKAFTFNNTGIVFPDGSFQTKAFHAYSGAFYDTKTQTNPVANTPRAMNLDTTTSSDGVTIVSSNKITIAHGGKYNIQFSAQLEKFNANQSDVYIWLRKNNVDVTASSGILTLQGASPKKIAGWNYVEECVAGDYFQVMWASSDTQVQLTHVPAQTTPFAAPLSPSVILTVTQVV